MLASCSGSFLAICERALSGAKGSARKAFALLIVFSSLILPVSAVYTGSVDGEIWMDSDIFGIRTSSSSSSTIYGFEGLPRFFELDYDTYRFSWSSIPAYTGVYSTVTAPDKQLAVFLSFPAEDAPYDVSFEQFLAKPLFRATFADSVFQVLDFTWTGIYEMIVDGEVVKEWDLSDEPIPTIRNWSGTVSENIEFRLTTTDGSLNVVDVDAPSFLAQLFGVSTTGFLVNNQAGYIQDISVSLKNIDSTVTNIDSTVTNIDTTVTNIENGVAELNGTVTDMSEQLQSPDSNIWQAGATTIKESVKELFVPPEEELEEMQMQLNLTLAEKAQPLYEAGEIGTEFVDLVVGVFTEAGAMGRTFEFPGISLPINGEIYELIPAQNVSINNEFIVTLQAFFGLLVGCLCFLSLIHLFEDAFFCIVSGVSFWGFIRGRHDR